MKHLFIDKTFNNAEELFEYLGTLKDLRLNGQNGVFQLQAESKDKQFAFIKSYYFSSLDEYRIKRHHITTADTYFCFYFRRGRLTQILLTSDQLTSSYIRIGGKWFEGERTPYNPKKRWLSYTEEQKRACFTGLVETLTVKGQKIS